MRAAAAQAVAVASAAANVAMAVCAKQEQKFLPHRQRAQAQNAQSANTPDPPRSNFIQVPPLLSNTTNRHSPRTSPRTSPRPTPRVGGSPPRLSPRGAPAEDTGAQSAPLGSGPLRRQAPASGGGGSSSSSAPAPTNPLPGSLRAKFSELRDEMKRRRVSPDR